MNNELEKAFQNVVYEGTQITCKLKGLATLLSSARCDLEEGNRILNDKQIASEALDIINTTSACILYFTNDYQDSLNRFESTIRDLEKR